MFCIVIENGTEQLCKYQNSQGQFSWVCQFYTGLWACNIVDFFLQN